MNCEFLKYLKLVAILSYLCIIIVGYMSALPLGLWLFFSLFNPISKEFLFSIPSLFGLLLSLISTAHAPVTYKKSMEFVAFILLLSPLVCRMTQVPLMYFNYWQFTIPLGVFIICYLLYIMLYKPSDAPSISS